MDRNCAISTLRLLHPQRRTFAPTPACCSLALVVTSVISPSIALVRRTKHRLIRTRMGREHVLVCVHSASPLWLSPAPWTRIVSQHLSHAMNKRFVNWQKRALPQDRPTLLHLRLHRRGPARPQDRRAAHLAICTALVVLPTSLPPAETARLRLKYAGDRDDCTGYNCPC
jgi:hypothetical protein